MSQAELARRARIPQTTVNSLIREDRRSSPHLVKIATVLQTSPAFLSGETDDPSEEVAATLYSIEEIEWMEAIRSVDPKERSALLLLAKSLSAHRPSPTLHSTREEYRHG